MLNTVSELGAEDGHDGDDDGGDEGDQQAVLDGGRAALVVALGVDPA